MEIIDSHIHVWVGFSEKFPMTVPPDRYPWWKGTGGEYIDEMTEAGIGKAVIVQIPYYGYDHAYAVDTSRRYPGRFAIVGLMDHDAADHADELERLYRQEGIQGIRLSPQKGEVLDSEPLYPLYRRAGCLDIPITAQINPHRFDEIKAVAARFRDTKILLDHVGGIRFGDNHKSDLESLLRLSDYENIYVKTSHLYGVNRGDDEEQRIPSCLMHLKNHFGADRLLFGSNWPLVRSLGGLKLCVSEFIKAVSGFSDTDKRHILGETARSLYRF